MQINSKLTKCSILVLLLTFGIFTISHADNHRFVQSTKGVQITIEVSSLDDPNMFGKITINKNIVDKDPAISTSLSLPMFNPGTLLAHNYPNPYPFFDWEVTLLEAIRSQDHNPFNEDRSFHPPYIILEEPQIFPPLPINYEREIGGEYALLDIPGMGVFMNWNVLPEGSVKKLSKNKYTINFDTCEFEYAKADICGVVNFTVTANNERVSNFTGERDDKFNDMYGKKKYKIRGTFTEETADVEGSVFGIELRPNEPPRAKLKGVISTHRLHNINK